MDTVAKAVQATEAILNEITHDEEHRVVRAVPVGTAHEINVTVSKQDMGKVIGSNGRVIKSIQELIGAFARRNNEVIHIHVNEPVAQGGPSRKKPDDHFSEELITNLCRGLAGMVLEKRFRVAFEDLHTSSCITITADRSERVPVARFLEDHLTPLCDAIGSANRQKLYCNVIVDQPEQTTASRHR